MARPREFDMETALDSAMRLFWAKGYDGASLDELLAVMGIGRGSLYKAFGSKHALYMASLALYDARVVDKAVAGLRDRGEADGVARIGRLLHSVADAAESGVDPPGCFLCNASVDQAPVDADAARSVTASLKRLDAAFAVALADTPCATAAPEEVERRAQRLTADYIGLRVLARSGRPPGFLRGIADQIVATV